MRRYSNINYYIVLALVSFIFPAPHQNISKANLFSIGFNFGYNKSKNSMNKYASLESINGVIIGVFTRLKPIYNLHLQLEVDYSMKGVSDQEVVRMPINDNRWLFRTNYLESNVIIRYNINRGKTNSYPYIIAGRCIGYLVNVKSVWLPSGNKDKILLKEFNRLEQSNVFGGGYSFLLHGYQFSTEVRYTCGLTAIYKRPKGPTDGWIWDVRNSVFSLITSFTF